VRYADDLVLLAKEEKVLQGITDRLTEVGRCHGMEMNVEKFTTLRIPKQPFPVEIITDKKQWENVEYLSYLGSLITDDARCTGEIKYTIITAKAAFNKKTLFTSKMYIYLYIYLRKELV
jgi:hypothetical protein